MTTRVDLLRYVLNTNGNATRADFEDDYDPIGSVLWEDLSTRGLVYESDEGYIFLTGGGHSALRAAEGEP